MIKVCKQKTFDRLTVCGKVFSKALQLFFLSWIPIGIYWALIGFDSSLIVLSIVFGVVLTFFIIPILRGWDTDGYNNILTDFNKQIKLFGWNEDC